MSGVNQRSWTMGAVLALVVGLGACDGLGLGGEPERLRVEIDAAASTDIVLVTSTEFRFEDDPACDPTNGEPCPQVLRVLSADTTTITPPLAETYPFTSTLRYFVEVFPATTTTTVTLRTFVDGDPWSNETRELPVPAVPEEDRETIQFVYQFREPRLQ